MFDLSDPLIRKQIQISITVLLSMLLLAFLAPQINQTKPETMASTGSTSDIVKEFQKLCDRVENRQIDKWTRRLYLERMMGGVAIARKLGAHNVLQDKDMKTMIKRAKTLRSAFENDD
jgi:hypothetical protein